VEARVGQNLAALLGSGNGSLGERISAFRKQYALDFGFVVPKVRIKDDKRVNPNAYQICLFGVPFGSGELLAERTLAIHPGATAASCRASRPRIRPTGCRRSGFSKTSVRSRARPDTPWSTR